MILAALHMVVFSGRGRVSFLIQVACSNTLSGTQYFGTSHNVLHFFLFFNEIILCSLVYLYVFIAFCCGSCVSLGKSVVLFSVKQIEFEVLCSLFVVVTCSW